MLKVIYRKFYIFKFILTNLSYRNWIKTSGKPDEHIFIESNSPICEKNYVECGFVNPLIYDRNKTLYHRINMKKEIGKNNISSLNNTYNTTNPN